MSQDADLGLLDLHVRVEYDAKQIVGRIPADHRVAAHAPVVRQPDLMHGVAADHQRCHPLGDQHPASIAARGEMMVAHP